MPTAARLQREYRARRRAGLLVAPVTVSQKLVDLVETGWLIRADGDDRQAVAEAVLALLTWWSRRFGSSA